MVSSTRPGGPGALRALRKRASAHLKAGRLAEAQALYVSLCKERPADTESWLALARINRRLGNFRDSEYCARQVLSNQPASYPALVEYGAAVYMQGRVDEAMAAYGRAIDVEPGGAEAHYYLATAYLESGRKGAATEHYRRTLESMPTHVGALNNLSTILTDNGRIKESLDLLEKAGPPRCWKKLFAYARVPPTFAASTFCASTISRIPIPSESTGNISNGKVCM